MASKDEVRTALNKEILESIDGAPYEAILQLAEAFAWTNYPNQTHGGSAKSSN